MSPKSVLLLGDIYFSGILRKIDLCVLHYLDTGKTVIGKQLPAIAHRFFVRFKVTLFLNQAQFSSDVFLCRFFLSDFDGQTELAAASASVEDGSEQGGFKNMIQTEGKLPICHQNEIGDDVCSKTR